MAGAQTFTVGVTDALQAMAQTTVTVTLNPALAITTSSLLTAETGIACSQALLATGGHSPLIWSIVTGTLPPGLTLNTGSGLIQGIPTTSGLFSFSVRVNDSGGAADTAALSINVAPRLSISTTSLPNGKVGQTYSQALLAVGGSAPFYWSVIGGNFPPGLSFGSSGMIVGSPKLLGPQTFTVRVTDAFNVTDQTTLTLSVTAPLTIGPSSFTVPVGIPFSQTLTAANGTPPFSWGP